MAIEDIERKYRARRKRPIAVVIASGALIALVKFGPRLFAHDAEHDLAVWASKLEPVSSVDCPAHDGHPTFRCTVTFETPLGKAP